jgi:hypothetical protein
MPTVITVVLCSFARAGVAFATQSELTYELACACLLQTGLAWCWHFYADLFAILFPILQSLTAIVVMRLLGAAFSLVGLRCC